MKKVVKKLSKSPVKNLVKSLLAHQQQEPTGHHKHAYYSQVHSDPPSQQE